MAVPLTRALVTVAALALGPELGRAQFEPREAAILAAADAEAFDHLGFSAAVDGDTVVVGAYLEGTGPSNPGAAYVFGRDQGGPGAWGQVAKLAASDGADADQFGVSVAVHGDTVVVGAWFDDDAGPQSGSAYVFQRDHGGANNWGEVTKLTAADAAGADVFGISVALSGDRALVGARLDDDGGPESGSAYLFERDLGGADNWGQAKKLTAAGATGGEWFGQSVALEGERAVVGALLTSSIGSAHLFEREHGGAGNWGEVANLTPSDGVAGNQFGFAVALSGETVVVGANATDGVGAAYVYDRDEGGAGSWGEVARLDPLDGAGGDSFGRVAIAGDVVLVGAPSSGIGGAAYTFGRDQNGADAWGQMVRFEAASGGSGDSFGNWVGLAGYTAVVGAPYGDTQGIDAGTAYVFDGITTQPTPLEVARLMAADGEAFDYLGWSVALAGGISVLGAKGDDSAGSLSGAAYVFERDHGGVGQWGERAKLVASDAAAGDFFGHAVAVYAGTAFSGAIGDDDLGSYSGSVYVFERNLGGANNWGEAEKLTAFDGGASDQFGYAVATHVNLAAVSAPGFDGAVANSGKVYVLERNVGGAGNWGLRATTIASDAEANDHFGKAVALHGETLVVGAPDEGFSFWESGSIYIFSRDQVFPNAWGLVKKIWPGILTGTRFGESVAIHGDLIVVGAHGMNDEEGRVFVYRRDQGGANNWGQVAELAAHDATDGDHFGFGVGIAGNQILVGAPYDAAAGTFAGSAYVFWRDLGGADQWGELAKILASDAAFGAEFGRFVATSGQAGLVGAPYANSPATSRGAAYVFEPLLAVPPHTYCVAGVSASGCQAEIAASGTPSATATSGFDLIATNVEGDKKGIFFFGTNGRQANSWGNGTSYQCVVPPVKRGALLDGGGAAGTCDGQFVYDLNARWSSLPNQNPGAGALVQAQLWYRDPFNTSNQTTSLSNAIEFSVCP